MQARVDHICEEDLERYVLGRLPALQVERLETHILICAECQDRLVEAEAYVQAVRDAALELSHEPRVSWWRRLAGLLDAFVAPRLVWVAGAVLLAAGLTFLSLVWAPSRPGDSAPVAVALQTLRGAAGSQTAAVPSGRGLVLEADLAGLPQGGNWELRLVDSAGRPVRTVVGMGAGTRVTWTVSKGLRKGAYWARLYDRSAPAQLVREYALRVE